MTRTLPRCAPTFARRSLGAGVLLLLVTFTTDALAQSDAPAADDTPPSGIAVVDETWPQRPDRLTWGAVPGIAVDGNDQVYVYTRKSPTVHVYRTSGEFVRSWSTENPNGPHCIRIDGDGNVWLTDFRSHLVQKYSPTGELLLTLGEPNQAGSDASHFDGPTDIAILPSGDVFISDGYQNRRVVHFDRDGRFVKAWGEAGTEPGQFALPHAIAADSQNRLYVADRNNGRIQVFDTSGKLLAVWDDGIMPWGLAVTEDDKIWVCGSSRVKHPTGDGWLVSPPADQLLVQYDPSGKILLRVPLTHSIAALRDPGAVDWVHAIAVDARGNLYLGDIEGKRAQKFSIRSPQQ